VTDKPKLPFARVSSATKAKPTAVRPGRFAGKNVRIAFYRWDDLVPGSSAPGPAVIAGGEATGVIPPGWKFKVDGFGNVIASSGARKARTS
jgi:N-methylhydantoinase A/oxoprolinase/acetone carboxylase beta subunit